MKRTLYNDLISWKMSEKRKPLLLQGARQVGKTWLVNYLGKEEYSDYIYLNFEEKPDLRQLFVKEKTAKKLIENISLTIGKKITSDNTLIFFDEVQIAPEVLTSLKYFQEQTPNYHIIAAGSLLGVSVGKQSGFPVGKVNFMTLYPMTFIEYLYAANEDLLANKISDMINPETLPGPIHNKLLDHFKLYLFLGGMPEVLQDYFQYQDIQSVRKIQKEILQAYERDFSKYTDGNQAIKTSELWNSIPSQLSKENKKFKYSRVRKKTRASTYEQTIEWLKKAGLIHLVYNIKTIKLPLAGYVDLSKFKIYFHDTGLLAAMLNLSSDIIVKPTQFYSEYNGAFIENFVAQQLVANGNKELFFWTSKSDAEVDFISQVKNKIYPLEVKSGYNRNLKSLRIYAEKYNPDLIYRTSPRNFIQSEDFINLPLYACHLVGISK